MCRAGETRILPPPYLKELMDVGQGDRLDLEKGKTYSNRGGSKHTGDIRGGKKKVENKGKKQAKEGERKKGGGNLQRSPRMGRA